MSAVPNESHKFTTLPAGIRLRGEAVYIDLVIDKKRIKKSLGKGVTIDEAIDIRNRLRSESKRLAVYREVKRVHPVKDLSRMPWGRPKHWMPNYLKRVSANAAKRGIDFSITSDEAIKLLEETSGLCSITGLPFNEMRRPNWRIAPYKPSLDRLDSSLGYSLGNCRWVCAAANIALADYGEEVFRDLALAYAERVIACAREVFAAP